MSRLPWPGLMLVTLAACSSSGGGASSGVATSARARGDAGRTTAGRGCEGVIADTAGATVQAIATDGTDAYVVTKGASGDRIVSLAKGGQLMQLASVQSDNVFSAYEAALAVDANAIYVDAVRGSNHPLVRVDRGSGVQTVIAQIEPGGNRKHPLFLADDQYLYFRGAFSGTAAGNLARVPKGGGTTDTMGDLFYGEQGLDGSLFQDSANTYYVGAGGEGAFDVKRASKTAVFSSGTPAGGGTDSFTYNVAGCKNDPFRVAFDQGFFANCSSSGGAWLYAMPAPGTPDSTVNAPAVPVPNLAHIDNLALYAAQGNLYVVADAPSGSDQEVYRIPEAGGTPTAILATQTVDLMTASATTLFLAAPCGIQSVAF